MMDELKKIIFKHWGYSTLRPLQEQAMQAVLAGRDSVVVMPTGGGKSLCYQAPAMLGGIGQTTVVVSPLIALMKDQVDSLRACGVPAIQLDSTMSSSERSAYELDLIQGALRLLFVSPERLANEGFCRLLQRAKIHTFAIDEAHCISHWGHDFRPDYRQLGKLKELFPNASLHAYTATATEQVRKDIYEQLHMKNPLVLVGNFDRPNLTYRIVPRGKKFEQIVEVVNRHKGEAGIIYCISRANVDELNGVLQHQGIRSLPYHAGMDKLQRHASQEAFATEKCDVIVATVAFGMGINRSNIRFVVHAGMPKSIEHYQQETGRAGRDGLEAECILLHGTRDLMIWKKMLEKAPEGVEIDPNHVRTALRHLNDMERYCTGLLCRHKTLVQYFGQTYSASANAHSKGDEVPAGDDALMKGCSACDVCLGDTELVADGLVLAQKILSCVARVQERYGINHVISVLRGENVEKVVSLGHDKLTTFGLLREYDKNELQAWIHQLVSQGVLVREGDEYPILKLNSASWEVMKKQRAVRLLRRKAAVGERKSRADSESWEGVERDLFEQLRELRRDLANRAAIAPHIVFSDHTLRELARIRPSSLAKMKLITGISDHKLANYGAAVMQIIEQYCQTKKIAIDVPPTPRAKSTEPISRPLVGVKAIAFDLFEKGDAPEDVAHQTGRSVRTVMADLAEYILWKAPQDVNQWMKKDVYDRVAEAIRKVGMDRLKPIFEELKGEVPYEEIRLVVAHLESMQKK